MSIINEFINSCKVRGDKTAFVFKGKRISYNQLLLDIYRMADLIKSLGITNGEKVLVLSLPSYKLYLLMLTGLCLGTNLVVPDSFKDRERINRIIKDNNIKYAFCDDITALAKPFVNLQFINISKYNKYSSAEQSFSPNQDSPILTTFTSGTTGSPKPINRSLTDLQRQIEIVSKNLEMNSNEIVFSMLPVYTLFVVFSGLTCVISAKIDQASIKNLGVTTVIAPISKLLKIKGSFDFVKKLYVGGAILYPKEAEKLLLTFPKAHINYIYGSSECVLMAKTELNHFLKTFAFDSGIKGINLSFVNVDSNGVGQICVSGDVVLSPSKTEISNDLGYMDKDGLHIVGRRTFSSEGCYNYLTDIDLLSKHKNVKKGFSFIYNGVKYFCYEGRLTHCKEENVTFVRFRKIPTDAKHKTKLDYSKAIGILKSKKIIK